MKTISPPETKVCEYCKKVFGKKRYLSRTKWISTRFCSRKCSDLDKIGKKSWNFGIKIDREKYPNMGHFQKHKKSALLKITQINRINAKKRSKEDYREMQKKAIISGLENHSYKGRIGIIGEKHESWKGNNASYTSKHKWIIKHWNKSGICQNCGDIPTPQGRIKNPTQWHNLDGKYDRENKDTWIELCSKCHKLFETYGYTKRRYITALRASG